MLLHVYRLYFSFWQHFFLHRCIWVFNNNIFLCFFKFNLSMLHLRLHNTTCWVYTLLFVLLTEKYYNISKSIDWIKFINVSRCSVISSCLLAGQFPVLSTYCLRASRCVWSSVQFYKRWSVVWTPCLQTHVACSSILKRWRYALVFPCTVIIAAMEGVMLIFMFSLS